jgi:hypothetical protein
MKLRIVLFLAIVVSLSAAAAPAQTNATKGMWTGWVSDEFCAKAYGMKHDPKYGATCAKQCLANASVKMVFIRDDNESVLFVSNPAALIAYADGHIQVTGSIEKGIITVTKASLVKPQGGAD